MSHLGGLAVLDPDSAAAAAAAAAGAGWCWVVLSVTAPVNSRPLTCPRVRKETRGPREGQLCLEVARVACCDGGGWSFSAEEVRGGGSRTCGKKTGVDETDGGSWSTKLRGL